MMFKIVKAVRNLRREGKNIFLNRDGSVLVTVVVAMAALLILGATLSTLALTDQRQAVRQQKNNEAYYLARSGAEAVAQVLLDKLNNNQDISSLLNKPPEGSELGSGRFEAVVEKDDDGTIHIHSTGYSGDYSEKVTLILIRDDSSDGSGGFVLPVLDKAVFSNGKITIHGVEIIGDIATNSTGKGDVFFDWGSSADKVYVGVGEDPYDVVETPPNSTQNHYNSLGNLDEERRYPMPTFPDYPTLPDRGSFETTWKEEQNVINQDGHYSRITVESNRTLTIDVGSGIRRLRVDHLDISVSGKIELSGTGKLVLYVDKVTFGNVRINEFGDMNNLLICYGGTQDLKFLNNIQIKGYLFTKTASLAMSGSSSITGGAFIGGTTVDVVGGSSAVVTAFYAPEADFYLRNSGHILGGVVCKTFTSSGNVKVEYIESILGLWDLVPELEFDTSEGSSSGSSSNRYHKGFWTD